MLRKHPEEVEADFQRYYGLNFWPFLESGGLRRVWVLLYQLPPESAIAFAIKSAEGDKPKPKGRIVRSLSELAGFVKKHS